MPSSSDPESKKMTEEQLRQVTVGELKPHDASITLAEYDPAWPTLFAREAKRITTALGPRALMLEHIGSTSIPVLVPKPKIHILPVGPDH